MVKAPGYSNTLVTVAEIKLFSASFCKRKNTCQLHWWVKGNSIRDENRLLYTLTKKSPVVLDCQVDFFISLGLASHNLQRWHFLNFLRPRSLMVAPLHARATFSTEESMCIKPYPWNSVPGRHSEKESTRHGFKCIFWPQAWLEKIATFDWRMSQSSDSA